MESASNLGRGAAWQQFAPWAGIAFGVLLVAGFFVGGDTPSYEEPDAWVTFFEDSGNRMAQVIGGYLLVLSGFAFLWFSRAVLARVVGDHSPNRLEATLAGSAATIFVAMVIIAAIINSSISASTAFADVPVPSDGNLGIQFEQLGFGFLLMAGAMSVGVFIGLASYFGRVTGTLPGWLVWFGYVVAVLQLLGPLFFPFLLVPIWAIATGVVLLLRPGGAVAHGEAASSPG